MYDTREAVQIRGFRPLPLFSSKTPWHLPRRDMEVEVSLATTGEQVYSAAYSEVNDLRVWELRLQICHEVATAKYFSMVLFRGHELLDDSALLAEYMQIQRTRVSYRRKFGS